jgi:hypothetical protein
VEQKVVETDLLLYLHSSLYKTKKMYGVEGSWPSVKDIKALVELSSGLFIFAATAAKFIQDRDYSDPQHQLTQLLNTAPEANSSPHRLLDQLYLQVLGNAFPNISSEFAGRLKMVLGSVALLCSPLSPSDLEQLLNLHNPLNNTLRHLQSVVVVPNDQNEVVHLIHPSFHDFLIDPKRCTNPKFLVTPDLQHALLAMGCFEAMKALKRDMCGIKQPWKLHHELDTLPQLVQKHIPPYLQYACRHWSHHMSLGVQSDQIVRLLEAFCKSNLLFWIEVCGLLGDLKGALAALKIAYHILVVCIYFIFYSSSPY